MTTSQHLRTIATTWTDLRDALGTPTTIGGLGHGLRGYLTRLDQYDAEEAAALRALERDPAQIGQRPIPISLRVYDTMRTVEAALVELADQTAAVVQRPPLTPMPARRGFYASERDRRIGEEDRARRDALARADMADPRRWKLNGHRTAPYAALWLITRIDRRPGPFDPLSEAQRHRIGVVAVGAVERIEAVLDLASGERELGGEHRCACGGKIKVYGGAGATPCANCLDCGALWTEQGIIVAA
ncbi:hypothetical protein [Streptomyces lunaelactis]|uniref:hypothetical protein n=1 Tax=Streptomyces lunaelactis TaxID=1535768 RepID=UPI0015848162|nr:hypothetical protein [Streptomyces lunaelactis]NUK22047.1 hypothetical protein [Streptomyces lunaelactis]